MNDLDDATDAELASRALAGEDRAFTVLMRRHKDGLYRFVRRYVGDADAAYEAVQESFVAVWNNLGRYDGARPFGSWLRTIALNKCRDRGRRETVRRMVFGTRPLEAQDTLAQADQTPDAEASLIGRERQTALDRAIAALPTKLKEPLILTCFEDLSHQAAGQLLGVSAKTIETRVYRARRKLSDALGLRDFDPGE
ncbi:MAG: RNA polymerase sigma factor [Pseudomonadota bacterium]|uniref:RNA polymerase sigma factor n=1 Tax=unclassified Phenylobacterium TaxID=2640670 RepID=UPI0006FD5B1D|nr:MULTISPECIES: RNA polymerase sigma factor [unclassified Phenylobacterium]KRB52444.1 RNA polymerase subunit sigma-24 [Phenylobacterium sp. Root700]